MKQIKQYFLTISSNLLKFVLIALIFAFVPLHARGAGAADVDYDPTTGKLNLKAENTELAEALALVSNKTGVWIRIAPSIEKSITIELTDTPLENALRRLVDGLNHAMFYESSQDGGHRLVGMSVLSDGGAFGADVSFYGRGVNRTYSDDTEDSTLDYGREEDDSTSQDAVNPDSAATNVDDINDEVPRDITVKEPADVAEMDESPAARKMRARRRGRLDN